MKYKLAVSPINWRNDDLPEIGGDNTLEKFLSEAQQIGFDGVEMGAQFPHQAEEMQELLSPYGLALAGGWFDIGLLQKDAAEQLKEITPHAELLRAMGCKSVTVCETQGTTVHSKIDIPVSQRKRLTKDEWQLFLPRLRELTLMMQDIGMPPSYHAHMGTVVENEEDIERMLEGSPATPLLYDPGHLAYTGFDPVAAWNKYESVINHVHVKDIRRSVVEDVIKNDKSFLQGVVDGTFTVPGDGDLDYDAILAAITKSSYTGWLSVEAEQDPNKAPPDVYAKNARDYILERIS